MTAASRPTERVGLKLLSFGAPGCLLADWLAKLLGRWQRSSALWLLLEQMHRYDFLGPDVAVIHPVLTSKTLCTFGLRGRLFWQTGQVEWRRLNQETHRVVAMTEESTPFSPPQDVKPATDILPLDFQDGRLVLWGTVKQGKFYEQRVGGSAPLRYPPHLENIAAGTQGTCYPVLPVRTYLDAEGDVKFRRFLPPTVCDEQALQKTAGQCRH